MTGIAGHDPGISGHVRPESLVTLLRNTHRFTMDEEQMQKFMALLDAPPVDKPKLVKLMSTPSPWEQITEHR
jgi:uncharacterized protein (DUF1778 family)